MKRRVFYVLHLDKNRILFLSFTFGGLLLFSFLLGQRSGTQIDVNPKKEKFPLLSLNDDETIENQEIENQELETQEGEEEKAKEPKEEKAKESKEEKPTKVDFFPPKELPATPQPKKPKVFPKKIKPKPSLKKKKPIVEKKVAKKKITKTKIKTKNKGSLRLANTNSKKIISDKKRNIYSLQLGAFRSSDAATRMLKQLQKQGFPATRVENKLDLHLVKVGKVSSLEEIKNLQKELKSKNYYSLKILQEKL